MLEGVTALSRSLRTDFVGRRIVSVASIDSTNELAKRLGRVEDGAIIIAGRQTAGKGRAGRRWNSPPEANLYLSIVLTPGISFSETIKLPLVTGIALHRAAEDILGCGVDQGLVLKWPNDLLCEGRKLGGILCETTAKGGSQRVIVGIGLNVNMRVEDTPEEIARIATSLASIAGKTIGIPAVAATVLNCFEQEYLAFLASGLDTERWNSRFGARGRQVTLDDGDSKASGIARGIDRSGALIVETPEGVVKFYAGDVLFGDEETTNAR